MTEPIYVCPACGSDQVTTEYHQKFMVNTGDHYCHAVKPQDADSPATCLACRWEGERKDLKEVAMNNTPSDEELGKLAKECGIGWAAGLGGMDDFLRVFSSAVLAKWGSPQPVVRGPLTDEQYNILVEDLSEWSRHVEVDTAPRSLEEHIHQVFAIHGIKGGQHGTE